MADKSGGLTPQLAIMLRATWTQIHPDKPFRLPWDPWASWSWDDYYRAGETYHPDNGLPHGDVGTTTKKL
jgi:hypothetical protein